MKLGFFADAHYARGLRVGTRECGRSLEKLERVLYALRDCDAVVNLGDLVNASGDAARDRANIIEAKALLAASPMPVYGVIGNHDVEAAPKSAFIDGSPHYAVELDGARLIALDANFTSSGESYETAAWDWADALLPETQLAWLARTLEGAKQAVVIAHQNLDSRPGRDGAEDPHVIRNARAARRVLEASGVKLCVVQGHCHTGGERNQGGIDYHTLAALCEGANEPCATLTLENGAFAFERIG